MNWLKIKYKCFIILGDPNEKILWEFNMWDKFSKMIAAFLKDDIKSLAVRVDQISLKDNKHLKFGKLKMDSKSNIKWTHNSPVTKESSDDWLFEGAEAWLPSWNKCYNLDKSPDFFLSLINEKARWLKRPVTINPILLLSFSIEKYDTESILKLILSIREEIKPVSIIEKERHWGIQSGGGLTYAMNDLILTYLFKQNPHGKPIDLDNFEEQWHSFDNK